MDRTVEELLADARELVREKLEHERDHAKSPCGCLWKQNRRVFLCESCRTKYPLYARMFDGDKWTTTA